MGSGSSDDEALEGNPRLYTETCSVHCGSSIASPATLVCLHRISTSGSRESIKKNNNPKSQQRLPQERRGTEGDDPPAAGGPCKLSTMAPKSGFMTPKAIANKIKAKGLQKLRWYCQMVRTARAAPSLLLPFSHRPERLTKPPCFLSRVLVVPKTVPR